jgi:hypothetical protein
MSLADVGAALLRRLDPEQAHQLAIKGLALAKGAGEQKPVFEIMPATKGEAEGVAWVSSEQYRRQASALFKLAKKLKIAQLYICAPGAPQDAVEAAGHPHLKRAFETMLKKRKVSPADWFALRSDFKRHNADLFAWVGDLLKNAPEAHKTLIDGEGDVSTYARAIQRLHGAADFDLTDEEQKAVEALYVGNDGKPALPQPKPDLQKAIKLAQALRSYGSNPTERFLGSLPKSKDPAVLTRLVDAILYLQTHIPPHEKFA